MLLFHTHTVNKVEMRERHHHDVVIVLDKGQAFAKHTIIHVIADTTDSLRQLILLDPAGQQFTDVVDVEAGCSEVLNLCFVVVTLRLVTHVKINDSV